MTKQIEMRFDQAKLARVGDIVVKLAEIEPLLDTVEKIYVEDNRRSILAGIDVNGNPLAPTTYRGSRANLSRTLGGNVPSRRGMHFGATDPNAFKGFAAPLFGNLTTAEYKKLDGPPMAPRRENSRVITNFRTMRTRTSKGRWEIGAGYIDVVARDGVTYFLPFHLEGRGRLPQRLFAGLRPQGRESVSRAMRDFLAERLRGLST